MKLQKLVCIGFSGQELTDDYWQDLDKLVENRVLADEATAIAEHSDADAILVKLGAKLGKDQIDKFLNLKYVGMLGTGYGGIDIDYAASKEITVTNIADYATQAVSEFTMGILLEYYRDISKARTQAKDGNYSDAFSGGEVKGKKFGVIGLGDIGKRTAQLASAFGADVIYWSRNRKNDAENETIIYAELDELIATSDIITINLALTPETEGVLNSERIKSIKRHSIVINPSPMELFDFDALLERLKKNDIIFMLDHSDEMTDDQLKALRPLDNVIVYPAIGYITHEADALKMKILVDNIKAFLDGNPTNKVN